MATHDTARPTRKAPAPLAQTGGTGAPDAKCERVINHEFRQLQLDTLLLQMLVFDLIDHCASLFEELTRQGGEQGARLYVRAYLIFNYFINTFIMVHFNGFVQFMELLHQDFIIYLNLYNFFRSEDIVGRSAFGVDLASLRLWVVQYLTAKDLLTFDVALLHSWLDEYIDYLKHKDEPDLPLPSQNDDFADDDDMFDFNLRFPDVHLDLPPPLIPKPADLKAALLPKVLALLAPYPVELPKLTPYPATDTILSGRAQLSQSLHSPPHVRQPRSGNERGYERGHERGNERGHEPRQSERHELRLSELRHERQLGHDRSERSDQRLDPRTDLRLRDSYPNGRVYLRPPEVPPVPVPHTLRLQPPPSRQTQPQLRPDPYAQPTSHGPYANGSRMTHSTSLLHQNPPPPRNGYSNGYSNERQQRGNWLRAHAICGLKNLGSSCYINLTVQVLIALEMFNNALLGKHRSHSTPLSEAMAGLIATSNANGGANIAPTKFLRVLSSIRPDFNIPFEQQDAQEFLLFLLDKLHEELAVKPASESVDYLSKWQITVNPREKDDYLAWYRGLIKSEGESPINDMFQGHVQSKLVCNKCGHKSISYNPFTILSLPIPGNNGSTVDLTDCLRYYTQDEVLTGENAWHCPKCNASAESVKENPMDVVFQPKRGMFRFTKRSKSPAKKVSAATPASTSISIKQLSFIKLPSVLFIHLSRFSMYNLTDKLNTDIVYPLRLKFNHHSHDIYYSLTGLINHYGNLKSGHYTALVNKAMENGRSTPDNLQNPAWCYFDDDQVRINVVHGDVNSPAASKLHSRDVYVLCYERV